MQQVPRGDINSKARFLVFCEVGRRTERRKKERRKSYQQGEEKGREAKGRVSAKYETRKVSVWNVTSLENVSRVHFSETLDSNSRVWMIIKYTGKTGRDAYRRNRVSWNNEAIGRILEKGQITVAYWALKAQRLHCLIRDRSIFLYKFLRNFKETKYFLNYKTDVSRYSWI